MNYFLLIDDDSGTQHKKEIVIKLPYKEAFKCLSKILTILSHKISVMSESTGTISGKSTAQETKKMMQTISYDCSLLEKDEKSTQIILNTRGSQYSNERFKERFFELLDYYLEMGSLDGYDELHWGETMTLVDPEEDEPSDFDKWCEETIKEQEKAKSDKEKSEEYDDPLL